MNVDSARKINKAIYSLIEKYHRLFGLEVYGFNSGHGPGYAGFQVAAYRCWEQDKPHANYDAPIGDDRQVLVTYFTKCRYSSLVCRTVAGVKGMGASKNEYYRRMAGKAPVAARAV